MKFVVRGWITEILRKDIKVLSINAVIEEKIVRRIQSNELQFFGDFQLSKILKSRR